MGPLFIKGSAMMYVSTLSTLSFCNHIASLKVSEVTHALGTNLNYICHGCQMPNINLIV